MNKVKNIITCVMFGAFFGAMTLLCIFHPADSFSVSERRHLKEAPELTAEALLSGKYMSDFEVYAAERLPFRDSFRSLKAVSQLGVFARHDNNDIYLEDGHISKSDYPYNQSKAEYAIGRFKYVCNKYLKDAGNIYFSLIPDKNYFLAENAGQLHIDYDKFYEEIPALFPEAEFIDIRETLSADSYYFTDSHWRQEKLVDTAQLLAESMGKSFTNDFVKNELDVDFRGVYHGQAALPLPGEKIYYLTNGATENAVVTDFEHMTNPEVYDMTKKDSHDPYEVFLSGPLSLVTVENPDSDGGHLVIFRDSFGSSIAPLLAGSYSKITLVDIRYLNPMMIPMVVRDLAGADVLFLYSTSVINNGDTIK